MIQECVLHGLLSYGPAVWDENRDRLHSDLFGDENRVVFDVISAMYRDGRPVDLITVAHELPESDHVDSIAKAFVSQQQLPDYIRELELDYVERRTAEIGMSLMEGADRDECIDALRGLDGTTTPAVKGFREYAEAWMDRLHSEIDNPNPGIQTGWTDLDRILGGIRGGNLVIVGGRPGMGKTAAALNIVAAQDGPALIFSLEMSESEVMDRLIASRGIDHGKLRMPSRLTDDDWPKITKATQELSRKNILINDMGGITISGIETLAERAHRAHDLRLIVVDYLQLVRCPSESRFQEVSEVSRRLKALAKNLDVPVLAVSQLNRESAKGKVKPIPRLEDLRESGQIEQDGDQILFVYREEVIDPHTDDKGIGEIHVKKNRHGELGMVTLTWQGHFQRFMDHVPNYYQRSAA